MGVSTVLAILLFVIKNEATQFNDPLWNVSWHLKDEGMNIDGAWSMGYTGEGVYVTFLDSGVHRFHPELYQGFSPQTSYDFVENDDDPGTTDLKNYHGTNMMGVVASKGNNSFCGVGIAPKVRAGMARVFQKNNTGVIDLLAAKALEFKKDVIDIYVLGFGLANQGVTVYYLPSSLRSVIESSVKGRRGKGNLILVPPGNEGAFEGTCAFSEYLQYPQTISFNSVGESGEKPLYAEKCTAIIASTYGSSFPFRKRGIVTAGPGGKCSENFSGTSASTAVGAGVLALTLEANMNLTQRDIQHLIIRSAGKSNLDSNVEWRRNGVGKEYSPVFGFGLVNAGVMVELARKWKMVPPLIKNEYTNSTVLLAHALRPRDSSIKVSSKIKFLEHVQIRFTTQATYRGNVRLELISPHLTKSDILPSREIDFSKFKLRNWTLLTLEFWGENPVGEWKLRVSSVPNLFSKNPIVRLEHWELILYGTAVSPE